MQKYDIGVAGLAVMGQNLVLNMSDHGFSVAVYNRTTTKTDEFLNTSAKGRDIVGADSFEELTIMDMQPSVNPIFGVSIDIIFPMNQRKWSLNNLLLFIPFDYQASVFVPTFISEVYDSVDYKISGSYIKLLTKMRYCFSTKQLKPFINIGISAAYLVDFQREMKREIYTYGSIRNYEASAIKSYKKTEIGIEFGAGLKIGDHLSTELVYEVSNGMSKYIDLVSNFQRMYIILNYFF